MNKNKGQFMDKTGRYRFKNGLLSIFLVQKRLNLLPRNMNLFSYRRKKSQLNFCPFPDRFRDFTLWFTFMESIKMCISSLKAHKAATQRFFQTWNDTSLWAESGLLAEKMMWISSRKYGGGIFMSNGGTLKEERWRKRAFIPYTLRPKSLRPFQHISIKKSFIFFSPEIKSFFHARAKSRASISAKVKFLNNNGKGLWSCKRWQIFLKANILHLTNSQENTLAVKEIKMRKP